MARPARSTKVTQTRTCLRCPATLNFHGNHYHLNAGEDPNNETYFAKLVLPNGKTFKEVFGPCGVLDCSAPSGSPRLETAEGEPSLPRQDWKVDFPADVHPGTFTIHDQEFGGVIVRKINKHGWTQIGFLRAIIVPPVISVSLSSTIVRHPEQFEFQIQPCQTSSATFRTLDVSNKFAIKGSWGISLFFGALVLLRVALAGSTLELQYHVVPDRVVIWILRCSHRIICTVRLLFGS